uniref:Uncharacterized protein n=1 Tax=Arundo donax TaxID=35708 RepID=A0A0A9E3W0_ARUDO
MLVGGVWGLDLCRDMASRPAQRAEGGTRTAPLQRGLRRCNLRRCPPVEDDVFHLVYQRRQPSQTAHQARRGPEQAGSCRQGLGHRRDQGPAEGSGAGWPRKAGILAEGYTGLCCRDDYLHIVMCSPCLHNDQRRLISVI